MEIWDTEVTGRGVPGDYIEYSACSPGDRISSFSGSMLPFPSRSFAFDSTPNVGKVQTDATGFFRIRLLFPNSYYSDNGTLLPPHVDLRSVKTNVSHRVILGTSVPSRTLTFPVKRSGACFYRESSVDPEDQYKRLIRTAYPAYQP